MSGGTDVIGQVGPAAASAYSFAEGYTNVGYAEGPMYSNTGPGGTQGGSDVIAYKGSSQRG